MKQLLENLIEQTNQYKILLGKAREKQQAIIQNNLEAIESLNKEEEKLIKDISTLESQRICHIENNPEIYGDDALSLTLEELKSRFPEGVQALIEKETKELMQVLGELRDTNSENADLLKQALRFVNVTINTITGADESNNYSKDKKREGAQSKARNLLDRKI
ncbi:MAG: flagellar protein FlgN [Clostridia bacterium]|nr:flagellar protein FlgN [Clostridia bacterium]